MGIGIQAESADLPPAAVARRVEAESRQLAAPPPAPSRVPQITEKLEELRAQIAQFRARAIDLHVKLVELESKGDPDVSALRAAMMASVVRIEGVVRKLADTPDPTQPPRFPSGTVVKR